MYPSRSRENRRTYPNSLNCCRDVEKSMSEHNTEFSWINTHVNFSAANNIDHRPKICIIDISISFINS